MRDVITLPWLKLRPLSRGRTSARVRWLTSQLVREPLADVEEFRARFYTWERDNVRDVYEREAALFTSEEWYCYEGV